jgi:G-protein alpha subunit
MGCGASSEAAAPVANGQPPKPHNPYATPAPSSKGKGHDGDQQETYKNAGIDRDLERSRQQEELKVKLLLLGAGESGKSTVFKQMRILHGLPRSDDDKRMYGVVVRSNVITAMRKLCTLLRTLQLEDQLAAEPKAENSTMSPKEAYDLIVAHLIDGTGKPEDLASLINNGGGEKDWVGSSARAGLGANTDAQQFLQLWRPIKTLWEVCRCHLVLISNFNFLFQRQLTLCLYSPKP